MAELHFSLDLNILLRDRLGTMQIFYTPTLFFPFPGFSGCHNIMFSEKFSDGQTSEKFQFKNNKFNLYIPNYYWNAFEFSAQIFQVSFHLFCICVDFVVALTTATADPQADERQEQRDDGADDDDEVDVDQIALKRIQIARTHFQLLSPVTDHEFRPVNGSLQRSLQLVVKQIVLPLGRR